MNLLRKNQTKIWKWQINQPYSVLMRKKERVTNCPKQPDIRQPSNLTGK